MRKTRFLVALGEIYDAIKGPSSTRVYLGETRFQTHHIKPTVSGPEFDIVIRSRQIVFETVFSRWWVPNRFLTVYEVIGEAPRELRRRFHPNLFQPIIYPLLCNRWLEWTEYPHLYAIHAYIDRALHSPYSMEVKM